MSYTSKEDSTHTATTAFPWSLLTSVGELLDWTLLGHESGYRGNKHTRHIAYEYLKNAFVSEIICRGKQSVVGGDLAYGRRCLIIYK